MIALHGGPGNDFNYLAGALRSQTNSYRFILFDQRGSLLSPVSDEEVKKLTLKILVGDLETLRKALGEEQIVLFGHSFGTLVALAYYEAYPEHVSGLLLCASVAPHTPPGGTFIDTVKAARQRIRSLRQRPEVKAELSETGVGGSDNVKLTPQQESIRFKIDGLASSNLYRVNR